MEVVLLISLISFTVVNFEKNTQPQIERQEEVESERDTKLLLKDRTIVKK